MLTKSTSARRNHFLTSQIISQNKLNPIYLSKWILRKLFLIIILTLSNFFDKLKSLFLSKPKKILITRNILITLILTLINPPKINNTLSIFFKRIFIIINITHMYLKLIPLLNHFLINFSLKTYRNISSFFQTRIRIQMTKTINLSTLIILYQTIIWKSTFP